MLTEKKSGLNYLKVNNDDAKTAIVLIHGYGASMHDLHGLHSVLNPKQNVDWYFPDGHIAINLGFMMEGRAWFPIDMQELERSIQNGTHRTFEDKCPNELIEAINKVELFLEEICEQYDHVILGGFSQGAMLASHLSAKFEKVKGLILFSATLVASNLLQKTLEGKKTIPFIQSHGKQDPLLNYAEAKKLFELLKLYGNRGEFIPFEGAHEIPMVVIDRVNEWLSKLD